MATSSLGLSNQLLIGELIKRAAHRTPDNAAVVYKNKRITFQELDQSTTKLAGWLQQQGVKKGEKVGFMLKNSLAFMELAIGVPMSGAVGVPINFRLDSNGVSYIVNHSDVKLLFIDEAYAPLVQSIETELSQVEKIIVVSEEEAEKQPHDYMNYNNLFQTEPLYKPCKLVDNDPGFIMYTSGTTGKPKGAVLTHKNICQNSMNLLFDQKAEMFESQLICAPQFHIAGLLLIFKSILVHGKTVVHRDFNPVEILKTIQEETINMIFLVPAMWNFLFQVPNIGDYDLTSIGTCATGAAITPLKLKKRILHYFPNAVLADNFGQTETTATATVLYGKDALRKPTSVGRPCINVEVRVVDEELQDVAVGEVGEILYRGPTIMSHYYKNETATEESFRSGWFHSGDFVRTDEEGFIYVVDRKVNLINSGGENIYPAEVEEILYQREEILECAVIGTPNEKWGEIVTAVVVLKPGENLSEAEIINHCKDRAASYKKPKQVHFIEELPRNASGKVLKYKLQEMKI